MGRIFEALLYKTHENMLNICSHQGDGNENHSITTCSSEWLKLKRLPLQGCRPSFTSVLCWWQRKI